MHKWHPLKGPLATVTAAGPACRRRLAAATASDYHILRLINSFRLKLQGVTPRLDGQSHSLANLRKVPTHIFYVLAD